MRLGPVLKPGGTARLFTLTGMFRPGPVACQGLRKPFEATYRRSCPLRRPPVVALRTSAGRCGFGAFRRRGDTRRWAFLQADMPRSAPAADRMLPRAPLRSAARWRSPGSPTSAARSAGQAPTPPATAPPSPRKVSCSGLRGFRRRRSPENGVTRRRRRRFRANDHHGPAGLMETRAVTRHAGRRSAPGPSRPPPGRRLWDRSFRAGRAAGEPRGPIGDARMGALVRPARQLPGREPLPARAGAQPVASFRPKPRNSVPVTVVAPAARNVP
jgi:hypothetical protein